MRCPGSMATSNVSLGAIDPTTGAVVAVVNGLFAPASVAPPAIGS